MQAWIADIFVVLGLLVMTVGVIGIWRMPTVYLQLHASSKAVFLGVIAFVLASFPVGDPAVIARGALIIVFLLLTTPVAAHLIARSTDLTERSDDDRD